MAYIVSAKQPILSTPWTTAKTGKAVDVSKVPPATVQAWLKTGVIEVDADGPDLNELPDNDALSALDRRQLLHVSVANKLGLQFKKSWSDEMIRQLIRDTVSDLSSLQIPSDIPE